MHSLPRPHPSTTTRGLSVRASYTWNCCPALTLDALRLSLMQDVLPVGLAAVDRVRRGGPQELIAAFASEGNEDPLAQLRQEGEEAARG